MKKWKICFVILGILLISTGLILPLAEILPILGFLLSIVGFLLVAGFVVVVMNDGWPSFV